MQHRARLTGVALAAVFVVLATAAAGQEVPRFAVDPAWPKQLPNNWILGQIGGIAVDGHDHVWVFQRPSTLTDEERGAALQPPRSKCCFPAPPVLEFDTDGKLLRAWGGPGQGYEWPAGEHGVSVGPDGNLWLGGNGKEDAQLLKFTPDGQFLMQLGRSAHSEGSNSPATFGRPALAVVDPPTNELYVADGYGNRRVIVLDATTGAYKRHWGAYGKRPQDDDLGPFDPDQPLAAQFRTPVHCVRVSRDGLVYVCDRNNNRVQVFQRDGTFVTEFRVEPRSRGLFGSVFDIGFSEDAQQKYLYVADGANSEIHTLLRSTGEMLGHFGHGGRQAGQFHWLHTMAVDSQGNIYTGEVDTGKRIQKFQRLR